MTTNNKRTPTLTGGALRTLRADVLKMSQTQLANELGLASRTTISQWESGARTIGPIQYRALRELCTRTGADPDAHLPH